MDLMKLQTSLTYHSWVVRWGLVRRLEVGRLGDFVSPLQGRGGRSSFGNKVAKSGESRVASE